MEQQPIITITHSIRKKIEHYVKKLVKKRDKQGGFVHYKQSELERIGITGEILFQEFLNSYHIPNKSQLYVPDSFSDKYDFKIGSDYIRQDQAKGKRN